jgi:hypothetical protein
MKKLDKVRNRREKRLRALARTDRHLPISFSIVGVQKAATSTFYMMLAQHPQVAAGPEKEMRFFIRHDVDWSEPDYSDYLRPAQDPRTTIAGDATPEYIFAPQALERMHRYNPDLRLMATFRDPIERAFSQWSMQRERDPRFPDVPEAIRRYAARTVPDRQPDGVTPYELRRTSLFTRGLYGQQVRRGLEIFPREQWLFLDFREIHTRPEATLDRVTDFLSISRFETYPELLHRNQTPSHHTGQPPSVDDIRGLVDLYADDLPEFSSLTGIDVSGWSTSRVLAGELSVEEFTERLCRKLGLISSPV